MKTNPVLRKLGYSDNDRLVIIHTDDIGMCNSSVEAFADLNQFGIISSGVTMVPCSWFPSVAALCRQKPNVDMGVHLTLTSEWDSYRWKPVSTCDLTSGLIDSEGYFYRSTEEAQLHGSVEAVKFELQQQIERAVMAGISITHIDTHMNTVAHPKYISSYIELAIQYHVPFLFPRLDEIGFQQLGMTQEIAAIAAKYVDFLEEQGLPLLDYVSGLYLDQPQYRLDQAKKALNALPPGITHFIIHPSKDTPEIKAIAPDWQCRVADYYTFMDHSIRQFLSETGLYVIGYHDLKQLITT